MQYLHTISTHTMDYIDAATSGILSPHVLPVADLCKMLQHITDTLPPTLHLPISPVDTLHFYRYLCTHVLIENKQFLLSPSRIELIRSLYIKFLLWISHMAITQPIMTSTLSTLESPRMQQWD